MEFKVLKNANGKTICGVDARHKAVEIVQKGLKTIISFSDDGQVEVENVKIAS